AQVGRRPLARSGPTKRKRRFHQAPKHSPTYAGLSRSTPPQLSRSSEITRADLAEDAISRIELQATAAPRSSLLCVGSIQRRTASGAAGRASFAPYSPECPTGLPLWSGSSE